MRAGGGKADQNFVLGLVEPHELAARYLRALLAGVSGIKPVRMDLAPPPPSQSGAGDDRTPRVILIDAESVSGPPEHWLRSLRWRRPEASPLVTGRQRAASELMEWLLLGMQGFIPFDRIEQELAQAVGALAEGRMWIEAGVLDDFRQRSVRLRGANQGYAARLTAREQEVAGLLERRLSNKEIGTALRISESTVKFHVANIFSKLHVRDRLAAAICMESERTAARG